MSIVPGNLHSKYELNATKNKGVSDSLTHWNYKTDSLSLLGADVLCTLEFS